MVTRQADSEKTRELLRKVRRIQVRTDRMVNDVVVGEYRSVFKGRGMEFEEVREYIPGDDIRTIDWNVTARTSTAPRRVAAAARTPCTQCGSKHGAQRERRPPTATGAPSMSDRGSAPGVLGDRSNVLLCD